MELVIGLDLEPTSQERKVHKVLREHKVLKELKGVDNQQFMDPIGGHGLLTRLLMGLKGQRQLIVTQQ
jgi:hypothetical protein